MKNTEHNKNLGGWAALASALVAIGLHAYLAIEFFQLKLGATSGKSLCSLNETFNCEVVAISPYATFLSVPMALWGLATNIVFLIALATAFFNLPSSETKPAWVRLSWLFSGILLLASLVMGVISVTKLGTYCLFCIGVYVTSIVIFIGTWIWSRDEMRSIGDDLATLFGEAKVLLLFLVAVPAAAFLSNKMFLDSYGAGQLGVIVQESLNDWSANKTAEFNTGTGLISPARSGQEKVTIVEFVDLFCPHCKTATPSLHTFAESRNDVKLIVKVFPLDATCNSGLTHTGDGMRCQWSYALFCSEKLAQKGWAALDWIFARQHQLNFSQFSDQLKEMNQTLQVSHEDMQSCIAGEEVKTLVKEMAAEGIKAEISGTPAIFLNGKWVSRGQMLPVLEAIYNKAKNQ